MPKIKTVVLVYKRDDLTFEQFMDYYENKHVPLAKSLLPMIHEYRRNYIDQRGPRIGTGTPAPDFDAITEVVLKDEADYDAFIRRLSEREVAARLRADEANFTKVEMRRAQVVIERS